MTNITPLLNHPSSAKAVPRASQLRRALDQACVRYGVPDAQLAVRAPEGSWASAHGAASLTTPFQPGSITKMLAAALVLDAATRGELDLDAPLSDQGVPGWGESARRLMGHTSGRPNVLPSAEETLRGFATRVAELPLMHEPGRFSYCNAAWSAIELLLERATGRGFEALAAERVLEPLGIQPRFGMPADGALSHQVEPGGPAVRVPALDLRAASAAGARWWATADELLAFGELYLRDGAGVIAPGVVAQQSAAHVAIPGRSFADAWGLGCAIWTYEGGQRVVGWDGYTNGQRAFLRICPERSASLTLLTSAAGPLTGGAGGTAVFDEIRATWEAELGLAPWSPGSVDGTSLPGAAPVYVDGDLRYIGPIAFPLNAPLT